MEYTLMLRCIYSSRSTRVAMGGELSDLRPLDHKSVLESFEFALSLHFKPYKQSIGQVVLLNARGSKDTV